jgi:hypothetical protein
MDNLDVHDGDEISGLDIIDIIRVLTRKSKAYQRLMLTDLEQVVSDPQQFKIVKKICLDAFNDYVRSVSRSLVGEDIER